MANTDTDKGESARPSIASRDWLNGKGERVPTGSPDVAAIRYTFKATGASVEHILDDGVFTRQCAAMGGLTKIGNVVNTIVNDDGYDGHDPMPEVEEWLAKAQAGEWREIGEGPRGPKYDKDVLAAVIHVTLGKAAKGDVAVYRTKLDDKSYYAKVRAHAPFMTAYLNEMAKRGGAPADSTTFA